MLLDDSLDPVDCTAAASVAVAEVVAGQAGLPARIKWPNDVMIGERKCCGILTEVVAAQGRVSTVVGIGLNVNLALDTPGLPSTATSLLAETGRSFPREALFTEVLDRLSSWLRIETRMPLRARWDALLWRRSQGVRLADGASIVEGVVEGLDPGGGLRLRLDGGRVRILTTGELLLS